jgi:hypothetical protein
VGLWFFASAAFTTSWADDPSTPFTDAALIAGLTLTPGECAALPHAVWVRHSLGEECIRYYPSPDVDRAQRAQFYFHGDLLSDRVVLGPYQTQSPASLLRVAAREAKSQKTPFIFVGRPGAYGSSGEHIKRRQPKEVYSLNAAVDAIKARHGLSRILIGGQSGGAGVTAALLTLGRTDIDCAVATSGVYSVLELAEVKYRKMGQRPRALYDVTGYPNPYDPIHHVDGIRPDPARRFFLIGDPDDQNTVFPLQKKFYEAVKAAGHHVVLLTGFGRGPDRHGLTHYGYAVSGWCAAGLSDTEIAAKVAAIKP